MKKSEKEPIKTGGKERNSTTNYRMSSHRVFCDRCYAFNKKICPVTETKRKSPFCNI